MRPRPAVSAQRGPSVRGCGLAHFHHMMCVPRTGGVVICVCVCVCVSLCFAMYV